MIVLVRHNFTEFLKEKMAMSSMLASMANLSGFLAD
jgi:hypothetical protein